MAAKIKRLPESVGPVRALALKHIPALVLLQRHVDAEWYDMPFVAEQMVAGYYYPEGVDPHEKEETVQSQTPGFDRDAQYRITNTESRRRSAEENEGRKIDGGPLEH